MTWKQWLIVISFTLLPLIGLSLVGVKKLDNIKVQTRVVSTPTATIPSLIPTQGPSERALKVASDLYNVMSSSDQKEYRAKWGDGSDTALPAIKTFAKTIDSDTAKIVLVESIVEKMRAENLHPIVDEPDPIVVNQQAPVVNFPAPIINQPAQSNSIQNNFDNIRQQQKQQCQDQINKYTLCLSDYQAKLSNYNSCLASQLSNKWIMCDKPYSFCGSRPWCSY